MLAEVYFAHPDMARLTSVRLLSASATTVLVITLGSGVDGFTLDPDVGQFLHTHEDIRIPPSGPIYSFNEANYRDFEDPVKRYLVALKEGSSSVGIRYVCGCLLLETKIWMLHAFLEFLTLFCLDFRSNARYVGALVADVHNILINGGIYGYPATLQNKNGKLRLLYESAPIAMIMENAGGAGSTGRVRILDVKPEEIHQRVPTYLGSVENVFEMDQFFNYYGEEVESDAKD